MSSDFNKSMLDMFIFETSNFIDGLEQAVINCEKENGFSIEAINEIFRIMHTIKGSSAIMSLNDISNISHSIEDLFYFLREENPEDVDCSALCDLVLEGIDFIKIEIEKIKNGEDANGDASNLISLNKAFLTRLTQLNSCSSETSDKSIISEQIVGIYDNGCNIDFLNVFKAVVRFEKDCQMENVRAFNIIHNLRNIANKIYHIPQNIMDDNTAQIIRNDGFIIYIATDCSYEEIHQFLMQTVFLRDLELEKLDSAEEFLKDQFGAIFNDKKVQESIKEQCNNGEEKEFQNSLAGQSIISVNIEKLDKLMDLMGEMVIAESMVTQNPVIAALDIHEFQRAARQLNKITSELQDVIMSIRMIPLASTFHKMHRIVRDMNKKLKKDVELKIIGEQTEVDKKIIEHISDPLMHLVRNSIDHGIESSKERKKSGKPSTGTITLEAKSAGSDVLVIVKDDGKGLNKDKILARAKRNGLLHKPRSEMTEKEIYNLVLLPGLSIKEDITEFSGRGVGMDVVTKSIEAVGGSVSLDSTEGVGTTVIMKIPLTLAIIYGMNISVGKSKYTIPITSIKEFFRPIATDILKDPDNNEMIMVRGQCYSLIRLHEIYSVKTDITKITDGILIMVEHDNKTICLFADQLLGQQQVVVKPLPSYIRNKKKIRGLAGCTLLGDGSISLILDIEELVNIGGRFQEKS